MIDRRKFPCFILTCDCCGERFGVAEDDSTAHFDSEGEAQEAGLSEHWTTDGKHWHCPFCSETRPLAGVESPVPVPVLPGQLGLEE